MLSFSHSFFSLSGALQDTGGVGGLLAVVRDDRGFAPTYDANGNVSEHIQLSAVQTDNYPSLPIAGGIVAHYEYSPFDEIIAQSGPMADDFAFRFSTKSYCNILGKIEYELRTYDPLSGHWLSRDLIWETLIKRKTSMMDIEMLHNMPVDPFDELLATGVAAKINPDYMNLILLNSRNLYGFCFNDALNNLDKEGQCVIGVVITVVSIGGLIYAFYKIIQKGKDLRDPFTPEGIGTCLDFTAFGVGNALGATDNGLIFGPMAGNMLKKQLDRCKPKCSPPQKCEVEVEINDLRY